MEKPQDLLRRLQEENINSIGASEKISPSELISAIQSGEVQNAVKAQGMGDNPLTWAGSFGLGAADMINDTVLGGTGYILGNLGRGVEYISPFSGQDNTAIQELQRMRAPLDYINQAVPYEDSWLTSAAKGTLGLHNTVSDTLSEWDKELAGEDPSLMNRIARGAGSGIGFLLLGHYMGATPLTQALWSGGAEALSEAGGFMGEAYRNGQYDNGALTVANKSFITNLGLNSGLNYVLGPFSDRVKNIANPYKRWAIGSLEEVVNEMLQEPSQQVIEKAASQSLYEGTPYHSSLWENAKEWPETFMQLAPEVAASTALTQGLLGAGAMSTKQGRQAIHRQYAQSRTNPHKAKPAMAGILIPSQEDLQRQYDRMIQERDFIQGQINDMYNSIGAQDFDTDIDLLNTLQSRNQRLQQLDNDIANFWPKSETEDTTTTTTGTPENVQPQPGNVPQNTNTSPAPDDRQVTFNLPENDNPAPNVPQKPQVPITPPNMQDVQPNAPYTPNYSNNLTNIRTMKGTEVIARYRLVDADDLIASTKETGAPNPNYPQELQPRQRDRYSSDDQISRIASNLDPELLGENRLASDGAPVIGPDLVVESGNGRILAIRRAYKYDKAENYRAWLRDNAARFGLNPDEVSRLNNPVLVRERLTDVDRVKFTSEANESSIATMSSTEHAVDDAKKLTPYILHFYDANKDFEDNTAFISGFMGQLPKNEQGDLKQKDGRVSQAGIERVRYALVAKAYNNTDILNKLTEDTDDDSKNVSRAIVAAAPKIAIFESGGFNPNLSIRDDIVTAVQTLANIKKEGGSVSDYLAQIFMFDEISDEAKRILKFFDDNKRGYRKIAQGLINYADLAMQEAREGQGLLPGLEDAAHSKSELLQMALQSDNSEGTNEKKFKGTPEDNIRENFKQLVTRAFRSEDEAEMLSHIYLAITKYFSKYSGASLEDTINADNLSIVYQDKIQDGNPNNIVRGQTDFFPEQVDMFGNVIQDAQTIMRISRQADRSTILHEMAHIFLRKLQRLATAGKLKGVAKQDWDTLVKFFGLQDIDFSQVLNDNDKARWTDVHEQVASAFEKYLMTGQAPNSKLQRVFEAFKRWLTDIYNSLKSITYTGSDGRQHQFEISPELKAVFDDMLSKGEGDTTEAFNQSWLTKNNDSFLTPDEVEKYNQPVRHATGHIIENNEFDFGKIGTGEGSAAYGWGAYFHTNPAVSETYRKFGLPKKAKGWYYVTADGTKIDNTYKDIDKKIQWDMLNDDDRAFQFVISDLDEHYIRGDLRTLDDKWWLMDWYNDAIAMAKGELENEDTPPEQYEELRNEIAENRRYLDALDDISDVVLDEPFNGNVYLFDVAEDPELLDWDETLNNQPEQVKKAFAKLLVALKRMGEHSIRFSGSQTGGELYHAITDMFERHFKDKDEDNPRRRRTRNKRRASLLLNKFGIPGLRFWDRGSRQKKSGTHNFVIWNRDKMKMLGLTEDSDEEAKQYFRDTQARKQGDNNPESYNQFISPEAARRLDEAEGTTRRTDNFKLAQELENQGVSTKKIWFATGYIRGADGEWRTEIPYGKIKQSHDGNKRFIGTLGDVFDAPELYTAYPQLKNLPYKQLQSSVNYPAWVLYDPETKKVVGINVNTSFNPSKKDLRRDIIHEIQHYIQAEEGFSIGSSPEAFEDDGYGNAVIQRGRYKGLKQHALSLYRQVPPEVRPVFTRLWKQLQSMERKEGVALVEKTLDPKYIKTFWSFNSAMGTAKNVAESSPYISTADRGSAYMGTAGEIEARNAAERAFMTDEERRNTPPDETEDTPRRYGQLVYRKGESYNQILSVEGAEELDKAEGTTWRMENLEKAKTWEKKGIDPLRIWRSTGWERGIDGKWRFEIMDGKLDMKKLKDNPKGNITDIFDAPELYKAYPQLKKMTYSIQKLSEGFQGAYNSKKQSILIGQDFFNSFDDINSPEANQTVRSTLIHEIQHAIQDYEGLARGGSHSNMRFSTNFATGRTRAVQQHVGNLMRSLDPVLRTKVDTILKSSAELDRISLNALVRSTLNEDEAKKFWEIWDNLQVYDKYSGENAKALHLEKYRAYMALAGEVEARNAAERSKMLEIERRVTPLSATEDIPRNRQLVYSIGESYKQIIGVKGAQEIDKQNGDTKLMDNLSIAKEMTEADKDARVIRKATGWELAPDGEWRYEIQDDYINSNVFTKKLKSLHKTKKKSSEFTLKVKDFYNNQELLKAYPQIGDMSVQFKTVVEGAAGMYHPANPNNIFNPEPYIEIDAMQNIDKIRSTLIHEIQHAIQDIEGFADGGAEEQFEGDFKAIDKLVDKLQLLYDMIGLQDYTEKLFEQEKNGEISFQEVMSSLEAFVDKSPYGDQIKKLRHDIEEAEDKTNKKFHGATSPYEVYLKLGGEIEARNAQARADFTPKQRRNTLLSETQEYDDWLIMRDGKRENFSASRSNNPESYNQSANDNARSAESFLTPEAKQEVNALRAKYKGTDTWLKAPNGEDTNLDELQWLLVRTKNFKNWFGDWENDAENASKILDDNGEPLVVYHGTPETFNTFDTTKTRNNMDIQGSFFTPWDIDAQGYGDNIMPVFLNIKNPASETQGYKALNLYKGQKDAGIKARNWLIAKGYDGVNNNNEEFIAFSQLQVKSSTRNNGEYSSNPEIYKQSANDETYSQNMHPRARLKSWLKNLRRDKPNIHVPSVQSDNSHIPQSGNPFSFLNPETERRYTESTKGIQAPSVLRRVRDTAAKFVNSFKGDFPELSAEGLEFAKEQFRLLQRKKSAQVTQAMQSFSDNLKGLSPLQLDLFARKRLLDDLNWRLKNNPDAQLPFGFDAQSLKKELTRFTTIADRNPQVTRAIKAEEKTMQAISKEFIDLAGQLGLKLDDVLRNPHYYRHTILEYANAAALGQPKRTPTLRSGETLQEFVDSELNKITGRSYLKKYKGSPLDISTNYIQANAEVRAQMLMDIEALKTLIEIKNKYDIAPKIKAKLRQLFSQSKKGNEAYNQPDNSNGLNISDVIPDGYTLWDPAASRFIQSANSVPDNILAMAIDDAAQQSGVPLDTIFQTLGIDGEEAINRLCVIPNEIADTIKRLSRNRERGLLGNVARTLTNWWKKAVLFTPTRNLKYNFRNFTGDLDAVIAGNPSALKFFGRAVKELSAHYAGKNTSQDLNDYITRSGGLYVESMQLSFNELEQLQDLAGQLDNQKLSLKNLPKKGLNLIKKFFQAETAFTAWREHLLRYAAYLAYKQDMEQNNGTPSTWGASIKKEVMSLHDIRDRAAKMSNELLGAYDQVSETGKQLREMMIPFYSWMEVNMRRYYRLLKNGFSGQNSSDFTKRLLLGQGARVPFYALNAAETFGKIALLSMIVQGINRFIFPDDDDELPPDIRNRPHITLGKIDGQVYYFDRIGALADAADWFGLDSIFLDAKELREGQQTLGGYMKKIMTAPASKILNGINPMISMPFELATGRSIYPDISHPRTIQDSRKYIASSFGLTWPYKAITGEPHDNWQEFKNIFAYSTDADEAAYFYSLDKSREFQERVLGKRFDGFTTTQRGQILRNIKTALRYNDREAVRRYLREYYRLDGTKKGLESSIRSMNPLYGLSTDEKKKFLRWLGTEDKKFLRRADRYYRTLSRRLSH